MPGIDSNTKLITHFDGPNNSLEIQDTSYGVGSQVGKIVTQVSTAALSAAQSKFGATSLLLNGSSDYLTVPDSSDWSLGAGPYTIEGWVRISSNAGTYMSMCEIGEGTVPAAQGVAVWVRADGNWIVLINNGLTINVDPGTVDLDTWYYVAVVHDGSNLSLYKDGVRLANPADTTSIGTSSQGVWIGKGQDGFRWFDGYIDGLRISQTARYTGTTHTVPTAYFETDSLTRLLLNMESTDVSSEGGNTPHIPDYISTTKLDGWSNRFGPGTFYMDGTTDYMYAPHSSDWAFGSTDFTWECWVKFASVANTQEFFAQGQDTSNFSFFMKHSDGSMRFYYSSSSTAHINMVSPVLGWLADQWYHVAVVREGSTFTVYRDGVAVDTDTSAVAYPDYTTPFYVGCAAWDSVGANSFYGYMQDARISDTARYSGSTYTMPSEPFTSDANTLLLLGGLDTIDRGVNSHLMTFVNTCRHTGVSRFDGGGIDLTKADSDSISFPDSADWEISSNWSCSFWMRFKADTSTQSNPIYFAGGAWYPEISQNVNNFEWNTGGGQIVASGHDVQNRLWHHILLMKNSSGEWAIYFDGIQVGWNNTYTPATGTSVLSIGSSRAYTDCYMDDLVIDQSVLFGATPNSGKTDTITVPDAPFIPTGTTVLYLPFDYNFSDESDGAHGAATIASGSPIVTSKSRFGVGSLSLNGSSDYISIPDSTDWDLVTQTNFTIDLWVKHTALSGWRTYVCQYEDESNRWDFYHRWGGTNLTFRLRSGGTEVLNVNGGDIPNLGWHHVALCKVGNEYGIYLNGAQTAYASDASTDTLAGPLYIGVKGFEYFMNGQIDELRIQHSNYFGSAPVVGLTDTITVPTEAYSFDAGWAHKFIGISDFAKLNGIDRTNIVKVIGV